MPRYYECNDFSPTYLFNITSAQLKNNPVRQNAACHLQYIFAFYFPDIYIFATGAETFDEDLHPLTVGDNYRHYLRLKDSANVHELLQEIIGEAFALLLHPIVHVNIPKRMSVGLVCCRVVMQTMKK